VHHRFGWLGSSGIHAQARPLTGHAEPQSSVFSDSKFTDEGMRAVRGLPALTSKGYRYLYNTPV
jgi:hypothetical protein